MILGFKTHINGIATFFVQKILACTSKVYASDFLPKRHSIREGKRWKAGNKIHMATGVRTKKYYQFNKDIPLLHNCIRTQDIVIKWKQIEDDDVNNSFVTLIGNRSVFVEVDGRLLDKQEIHILANNDGFYNILEFFNWFNIDFNGQIIHWTDLKY